MSAVNFNAMLETYAKAISKRTEKRCLASMTRT